MADGKNYPMTHQGIRDLDKPIRPSSKVNIGSNARAASALGGAVLTGLGVSKGGLIGLALVALGGALVYRGQSGYCSAHAVTTVNTVNRQR